MAMNSALDLQIAIYDTLVTHSDVTNALGGTKVFDDVPQGTNMPYIAIGQFDTRDWDTQTAFGHEHIITLHVWSHHRGRKQVQTIIAAIDDALDNQSLSLQDHHLVNLRVIFWSAMRELDGKAYHGVVRLRAVTEKP